MIRPKSIVNFERLYLGSWLVGLASQAINWNATKALLENNPGTKQFGMGFMTNIIVGTLVFSSVITLLLWYFAARQHSVVAKWFLVVCFIIALLGIPGIFVALTQHEWLMGGLALLILALHAGAISMLFQRDAREWFGEIKGPPSDRNLNSTFQ